MKDLSSNISPVAVLAPAVQAASIDGTVIDRKGFESVTYILNSGAIVSAGLFGAKLQDSDDNVTYADVASQYLIGTLPTALAASTVYRAGYVGHKQYTKLVVTKTSGTSIALGAVAILGDAHKRPVA